MRSDYIFPFRRQANWSWRIVSEDSLWFYSQGLSCWLTPPIRLSPFLVLSDSELFQHLVNFYNYNVVHSYCCRLLELEFNARHPCGWPHLLLTYQHWAGVSPYTEACAFAGTCVFDKQSTDKLLLKPWLNQGNPSPEVTGSFFAEFLEHPSLAHLSLLD